ncbi:hypothetical protein RUM43_011557 [Polyplax serrata]|uniref:Uncharacterized protein n=1 Tax=Polyplax serrata TaxID=468196 RepID=A0AAN8NTY3_POLSC
MWSERRQICRFTISVCLVLLVLSGCCEAKKPTKKKPDNKETSIFNFVRLIIFRMVYGFATMFGAQEGISEIMDGIFVPPGADEGDYRDYLDGEDEDFYY